jgi:hypothetical protein
MQISKGMSKIIDLSSFNKMNGYDSKNNDKNSVKYDISPIDKQVPDGFLQPNDV